MARYAFVTRNNWGPPRSRQVPQGLYARGRTAPRKPLYSPPVAIQRNCASPSDGTSSIVMPRAVRPAHFNRNLYELLKDIARSSGETDVSRSIPDVASATFRGRLCLASKRLSLRKSMTSISGELVVSDLTTVVVRGTCREIGKTRAVSADDRPLPGLLWRAEAVCRAYTLILEVVVKVWF